VNAKVLAAAAVGVDGVPAELAGLVGAAAVVALGPGSETNEMFTVWNKPPASPKFSWHETPAASCADVGGQGYFPASTAGFTPALSVAGQLSK
jgi:hypothetical protein